MKTASLQFSGDRNKTVCVPSKASAKIENVYPVLFIHCSLWEPVWMPSHFCQENWLLVNKLWPRFQRHIAPRTANESIRNGLWSLSSKENESTTVNSHLYGSLLLLYFFENKNNDNHLLNCLPCARRILSILLELLSLILVMGFPGGSDGKETACNAGDLSSVPGLGRSPRGGRDNPLQYSCLENAHGQRSLAGYSPWGHKESDMTEQPSTAQCS